MRVWYLLALLATFEFCLSTSKSVPPASAIPSSNQLTESICPSRTVNYITHRLPQQCLTSSWQPPPLAETPTTTNGTIIEAPTFHEQTPLVTDDTLSRGSADSAAVLDGPAAVPATSVTTSDTTTVESVIATVVASSEAAALQTTVIEYTSGDEGILEDTKFLSFEEWKKQNLLKAGQSEHVGKDTRSDQHDLRKCPSGVQNALDSIGDDAEIDLDFRGFVPSGPDTTTLPSSNEGHSGHDHDAVIDNGPRARSRSKDAGTTCKERFNYASFDCAANILKTNPQAKSASSVLVENKDAYMLNTCSADDKFIIIELCNDISVDTVVLANFEFFSSIFREFRVSVSDKYPVKADKWKPLGTFEARNTREIQAFLIENPVIWARYLRIDFLTHYGCEYYCPISLVRVHGTTMLEEYKHDLEQTLFEEEGANSAAIEEMKEVGITSNAVVGPPLPAQQDIHPDVEAVVESSPLVASGSKSPFEAEHPARQEMVVAEAISTSIPQKSMALADMLFPSENLGQCSTGDTQTAITSDDADIVKETLNATSTPEDTPESSISSPMPSTGQSAPTIFANASSSMLLEATANTTAAVHTTSLQPSSNIVDDSKVKPSSTQSLPATPTMQESFFKSVQKRLQMLESNSSLSLQYIEEQSKALRDAFSRVEQRQLAKTTTFLDYLNVTVVTELRDFRVQYDQLWQATVLELQNQRERYDRENAAIYNRLGVLADEVVFQRRLAILQMILVLVCLALVLFSRGTSYLEVPLVQHMLARSPSSKRLNYFGPTSPTPMRPSSTSQPSPRYSHQRKMSDENTPLDVYPPLTPISYQEELDNNGSVDPEFDPKEIIRPSTSPPILPSGDSPISLQLNSVPDDTTIEARMLSPDSFDVSSSPPQVIIDAASPVSKHLTWQLPNG